jgi:S-adenosylmethionine hydrolase
MTRRLTRPITTPAAARLPHEWSHPFVSLLSDWGARDPSAAICKAVVMGIAPDALIVDITHEVDKYNVRHGALMLWCALPFMPVGAHMAVVDPGVGTARRPVAIETARGDYLVGPDNGLLLPAAERLGGVMRAHLIENAQYSLPVVSSTFHGRDLFAPAAAHLALGVPLESIGPELAIDSLANVGWPPIITRPGRLETSVIYRDTFGNLKLSALTGDLLGALDGIAHGEDVVLMVSDTGRQRQLQMKWAPTFGEVALGDHLLYEDSYGRLCIAQNQGNAALSLPLAEGDSVTIVRPSGGAANQDQAVE